MLATLSPWVFNVLFPINRWVHLVGSTLLVGGVLFFEFVVPLATADLKDEQRLAVFGRARWVFRKVAWFSVVALLLSGAASWWSMWQVYAGDEQRVGSFFLGPKPWVIGHAVASIIGCVILLKVTRTRKLIGHPVEWLRVVLVVFLVSMFVASVARQVRLRMHELRNLYAPLADEPPHGDGSGAEIPT
jgi:uncharacterized membrane protein